MNIFKSDPKSIAVADLTGAVLGLAKGANRYIKTFIGYDYRQEFVLGYSIGLGIEINRVLNSKGYYYRYLGIDNMAFSIPIFHFSFNYSMRY